MNRGEIVKTKNIRTVVYHVLVCGFGLAMLYPLCWMFMSSFKETSTIFTTAGSLIPVKFTTENYANGWRGFAGVSFGTFFKNSLYRHCGNHRYSGVFRLCCLWLCQMSVQGQENFIWRYACVHDVAGTDPHGTSVSVV